MFKINLRNSFLFLLIKYIVFFFVIAFIGDRFKNNVTDNAETTSDMFRLTLNYALYVLIYAIPLILVFGFPLHYILKIKKVGYFLIAITLLLIIEYCVYTFLYSPSDKVLGIYNAVIGIILLGIFFHKTIRLKFTEA